MANPSKSKSIAHSVSRVALAKAVLQLADAGGMPDTYWETDARILMARKVLGVPQGGRYSHCHLWAAQKE